MFASDVPEQHVQLFVTPDKTVASSTRAFTEREGAAPATTVSVPTTTLNTVLEQAGVTRLDFMSMDIELHEPKALGGSISNAFVRSWCVSRATMKCASRSWTTSARATTRCSASIFALTPRTYTSRRRVNRKRASGLWRSSSTANLSPVPPAHEPSGWLPRVNPRS